MKHSINVSLRKFTFSSVLFFYALSLVAASKEVMQLATWETRANAASVRDNKMFKIEHFEIPLAEVVANLDNASDFAKINESLVFEKNGQKFVRWIINPEDTKWHLEVEAWLKSKKIPVVKGTHFNAWFTSSRSMILEDPVTGAEFSAKVSTNNTGGNWRDKKQDIGDATEVRMASDYVKAMTKVAPFKHSVLMFEPAELAIPNIDQAMLVRSLAALPEGGKYYLPGFSALHEETGREIAKKNGSNNPAEFWREHYAKPLGRSLAEFTAYTGLTYSSPHSQNFLIELDANMKPTGKIVLRDYGDNWAFRSQFEYLGLNEFLNRWSGEYIRPKMEAVVGFLHGNKAPSWMSSTEYYDNWSKAFFDAYEGEFARISKTPIQTLQSVRINKSVYPFSYVDKTYSIDPAKMDHLNKIKSQVQAGLAADPVSWGVRGGDCDNLNIRATSEVRAKLEI